MLRRRRPRRHGHVVGRRSSPGHLRGVPRRPRAPPRADGGLGRRGSGRRAHPAASPDHPLTPAAGLDAPHQRPRAPAHALRRLTATPVPKVVLDDRPLRVAPSVGGRQSVDRRRPRRQPIPEMVWSVGPQCVGGRPVRAPARPDRISRPTSVGAPRKAPTCTGQRVIAPPGEDLRPTSTEFSTGGEGDWSETRWAVRPIRPDRPLPVAATACSSTPVWPTERSERRGASGPTPRRRCPAGPSGGHCAWWPRRAPPARRW
jgi:hypothetical protein